MNINLNEVLTNVIDENIVEISSSFVFTGAVVDNTKIEEVEISNRNSPSFVSLDIYSSNVEAKLLDMIRGEVASIAIQLSSVGGNLSFINPVIVDNQQLINVSFGDKVVPLVLENVMLTNGDYVNLFCSVKYVIE